MNHSHGRGNFKSRCVGHVSLVKRNFGIPHVPLEAKERAMIHWTLALETRRSSLPFCAGKFSRAVVYVVDGSYPRTVVILIRDVLAMFLLSSGISLFLMSLETKDATITHRTLAQEIRRSSLQLCAGIFFIAAVYVVDGS